MRSFALAALAASAGLAVTGCGSRGPAWPRSAGTVASTEWSEDGGESIAPHTARAAAVERSAEPAPEAKPADAPAAKPAEPEAAGSGSAAVDAETPLDLPELGEEIIIIEIGD
jgi:hypothetical protein